MDKDLLESVRVLVDELVAARFDVVVADGRGGRLSAHELHTAIAGYGRTLVPLPDAAVSLIDVYAIESEPGACALDVPLWTAEEGRSDLTLFLRAASSPAGYRLEIDDLRVP